VSQFRERAAFLLLLIAGIAPRLALISRFPAIPVSDFHDLVVFGLSLRDHGLLTQVWFWEYLSPGLPLILCGLFHIFSGMDPEAVARVATALVCGTVPVLPFLIWRGVLPMWVRVLAAAALAFWPGQILFSGVVAQDNWVLAPSVALASLAVRALVAGKGVRPVTAGLLYAAGVIVRQEMLVALFPLFLAAAGVRLRAGGRRLLAAGLAAGLPLLALATYRMAATGRFALNSVHAGSAILSSYIPGAAANAYADPYPYTASVRPDLLRDRKAFFAQAGRLALDEALRRPGFQAAKIASWVCTFAVGGESSGLYWSLGADALPEAARRSGAALAAFAGPRLRYELAVIQGLFLAALLLAIQRRSLPILVLASAVLLKYAFHAVTAIQGRYFLAATALELLAIALAVYEIRILPRGRLRLVVPALAAGAACGAALLMFTPRLAAYVVSRDTDEQRTYRFVVEPRDGGAELACTMSQGRLMFLARDKTLPPSLHGRIVSAAVRTWEVDPAPGAAASARCELTGTGESRPLALQVLDPYAAGGLPGRMVQRVEVDGVEVYLHDIAKDPGSGWADIPLGQVEKGTKKKVVVEVKAVRPDPGAAWGEAARTTFRLMGGH
jgi:hypothetical protein